MKQLKLLFIFPTWIVSISLLSAQNKRGSLIDANGNVFDTNGKHIGRITTEGVITNQVGTKVAAIDGQGCLVDTLTTRRSEDNYYSFSEINADTKDQKWTISVPVDGICKVKDKNGNTIVEVHKNFSQYGACTYNCLAPKNTGK